MDCAYNIITANFSGGKTHATTARVYQWSRGIELCITGADNLPQTFKAHFSVQKKGGVATTIVGIDERVTVPNVLFTIGKDIHVWLGASETEDDAEILYTVDIPVAPAPMPEYYDAEDTGVFDAVVEQVSGYAATATAAANSAGASATAAAGSASAAAASASSAAGSAAAAEQARANAVTAKGQAETAAQTATEKALQTAQNASQAALDAGRAESAAERAESAEAGAGAAKTAAEAAAQSAAASAATADEKASLAGQSATAAAGSASAAAQSAASIEGDVQIASQKASEAQTAAGQAVTAKDAAVTAQQGAETSATNAGQSASTATAKASEAATSASGAAQSKTDAEAAAARAEQAAATLTVDSALSDSSTNPVQNKVITGELTDVKSAIVEIADGTLNGYQYCKFTLPANSGTTIDWESLYIKSVPSGSVLSITFLGYYDTNFTRLLVVGVDANDQSTNLVSFTTNATETKTVTTTKAFVKFRFILRRNGNYTNAESYDVFIKSDLGYGIGHELTNINNRLTVLDTQSLLSGVKWDVMGDSLTNKDSVGQSGKNYVDWITDSTHIDSNNIAQSGKDWWNGFLAETQNIRNTADVVTIFGSFNEFSSAAGNIGVITDAPSPSGSFCARVKNVLNSIYAVKNDVKIGVILPTPWVNINPYDTDSTIQIQANNILEALKAVCDMYSIPVLDLYHESMMRPWDETFRNTYYRLTLDPDSQTYVGDGVHPNTLGHKLFVAPKIEAFLKTMLHNY